jgi:hypothetical protein
MSNRRVSAAKSQRGSGGRHVVAADEELVPGHRVETEGFTMRTQRREDGASHLPRDSTREAIRSISSSTACC